MKISLLHLITWFSLWLTSWVCSNMINYMPIGHWTKLRLRMKLEDIWCSRSLDIFISMKSVDISTIDLKSPSWTQVRQLTHTNIILLAPSSKVATYQSYFTEGVCAPLTPSFPVTYIIPFNILTAVICLQYKSIF